MNEPKTFLAVKNWERFQHYRDRHPPWIKLHIALLEDIAFNAMSDRAQIHLVKLWMLASRLGNPLPNDPKLLAGKIGVKSLALAEIISAGFLLAVSGQNASDVASTGASKMLAEPEGRASTDASTRARPRARERERERERENKQLPAAAVIRIQEALSSDVARTAFSELVRRTPGDGASFAMKVEALAGLREWPSKITVYGWPIVESAMIDLAQKSAPVTHLEAYCRAAEQQARGIAPDVVAESTRLFLERGEGAAA